MKTILLVLIMAIVAGCVPYSRISTDNTIRLDGIIGCHYTEIMNLWGPPSYRESDGMGGQILIWTEDRILNAPSDTQIFSEDIAERDNSFFKSPQENPGPNIYTFWVNANGFIYRTSYGQETLLP